MYHSDSPSRLFRLHQLKAFGYFLWHNRFIFVHKTTRIENVAYHVYKHTIQRRFRAVELLNELVGCTNTQRQGMLMQIGFGVLQLMPIHGNQFEQKIIVEQLGVEESKVEPDTHLMKDLEADSLDAVEIIMAIEEEYGIEIPDEDAEKFQKVSDLVDFVEEKSK